MRNLLFGLLAIASLSVFISCESKDEDPNAGYGILPQTFTVDVPSSLSYGEFKSTSEDTLLGNEIYEHLKFFIAVGEGAAQVVEDIMFAIKVYKIENVVDMTYLSDEDNRMKHLTVVSDVEYNGKVYEYKLTLTDLESESNEDGGIAMQVFWNNNPVEGVALLKPYNIDRIADGDARMAMYSIKYSSAGTDKYDETMTVQISGIPIDQSDEYSLETMKMFVGKKGDLVDVYGNSNHPIAQFNKNDVESIGFNWAFVASADKDKNIAVAEVGLPPSNLESSDRSVILVENSIKNVLTREITNYVLEENPGLVGFEDLIAQYIAPYLKNTEAPGFFDASGFVQAKDAPNADYTPITNRIGNLSPFVPAEVSALEISFD